MAYFPLNKNHIKPSHMDGSGASKPTITPALPSMKESIATTSKKKLSECRVLVVENNPIDAELLQLYLLKSVKFIYVAETAQEALSKISEAAKNGKFDLVLCGMRPGGGKSGIDVAEEASKISPGTLFVLASTGDRTIVPEGMFALQKPISKEALINLLGKHFES